MGFSTIDEEDINILKSLVGKRIILFRHRDVEDLSTDIELVCDDGSAIRIGSWGDYGQESGITIEKLPQRQIPLQ